MAENKRHPAWDQMAFEGWRPSSIPTKMHAIWQAETAWHIHAALALRELREPALRRNPAWQLARLDAFEAFVDMLGRVA